MSAVDGLTKVQQQELAKEAIVAAKNLGYCDEAVSVLREMGFILDDEERTVTLTIRGKFPFGFNFEDASPHVSIEDENECVDFYSSEVELRVDNG